MPIFTDGLRLEGDRGVSDYAASLGQSLGATVSSTLADSPIAQLAGIQELDAAGGRDIDFGRVATGIATPGFTERDPSAIPSIGKLEAAERVKAAGLEKELKLPERDTIPAPVLDIMINRARDRRELEATIARGPQGILPTTLQVGTSFLVGAVDPLNVASAFIPVVGELRYAKLLAGAGESLAARSAVRAGTGAASGVVGQAALEPLDWYAHTQDGRDYGMADVLRNLVFGAALGGTMHAGGGAIADILRTRRERPFYPYDLGEPLEYHTPFEDLHTPGAAPAPGLPEFPGMPTMAAEARAAAAAPVQILEDMPPRAKEDAMRAAIANLVDGEPVRVGELLHAAAGQDPRIAEAFDAPIRNAELSRSAAREAVFDDIHQQLVGAGMPDDEAAYNAAVVAARYSTRADRLGGAGGNAAELYHGEHLAVRSGEFSQPHAGRSFNQPAIIDGVRVNFPDADHIALFDVGQKLARGGDVDEAEAERLFRRFHGFMVQDVLHEVFLRDTRDLREAAREYHDDIMEQLRHSRRPFEAWDVIDADLKEDWYRRALDEATAGKPAPVLKGQLQLFQSGRRKGEPDLFAQREAAGQTSLPGTERISRAALAQRQADEALKARVAQKPMDIGLFGDEKDQTSLFQQGEGEAPRGRITLSESGAIVDLFKGADQSTFMHESAHLWLDELMRDAEHAHAGDGLKRDRDTVLEWLGVKNAGDIGTDQHEKWAEGFEHYLATSEAPSNALAKAFEQFKQWLAEIYRAITGAGREISPEIRTVMDRLLATDQEIADRRAGPSAANAAPEPQAAAADAAPAVAPAHEATPPAPHQAPAASPAPGNPRIVLGAPAVPGKPKRGRAAAHPDTWSLNEHLASKGGLRPDPELATIYGGKGPFVPGFGPLIRKSGMTLDDALTSAKEQGYFYDPHDADNGTAGAGGRTSMGLTPRDLLDHLDNENRGQKLYKAGHLQATKFDPEQEKHVILGHVEAELEAAGHNVADVDPKLLDRTVEIVHREGERDVLAAYERAIIEDADRYEAIANARDAAANHPARDVPYDAGSAPGRSGSDPVDGGPARSTGQGERGADGAQPSRDGVGDRRTADQSFRDLAAGRDADGVSQLEASRAADTLPEPVVTKLDARVTAAEKADAFAKQMYDMFSDRLPPEERQRLDDLIKSIDDDAATRKEAIERSGACLFGARA